MIRVIIFIGILFSPLLANATNKSLSNDLAVEAIKIAEKDLESAIFLILKMQRLGQLRVKFTY